MKIVSIIFYGLILAFACYSNEPINKSVNTLNHESFVLDDSGDTSVRTVTTKSALPSGAATESTLSLINGKLSKDAYGNLIIVPITHIDSGDSFGDVLLTTINVAARVNRTVYTQPSTDAQRSFASSSANDSSAGTGLRTLLITYFDSTGLGPYTETITLNGVTPVNTVAVNICYIEKIEALTVGSGGINAGLITLFSTTAGGGTTIGTIAIGDNKTFWSHHYCPISKTCLIDGVVFSANGTAASQGASYYLKKQTLNVANQVDIQFSPTYRLFGQSSSVVIKHDTPIPVIGPARIQIWATPESGVTLTYRGAMEYHEQ